MGTVQRYSEWNNPCDEITELAEAVDIVGANIYPFYVDSLETIDDNLDKLEGMMDNVQGYFPGKNSC